MVLSVNLLETFRKWFTEGQGNCEYLGTLFFLGGGTMDSSDKWKLWRPFQDNDLKTQVMEHSGLQRKPMALEHSTIRGLPSLSREET